MKRGAIIGLVIGTILGLVVGFGVLVLSLAFNDSGEPVGRFFLNALLAVIVVAAILTATGAGLGAIVDAIRRAWAAREPRREGSWES